MTRREFFVYGSVLEALSFGLYPDKRHVIREFVQNAFDALSAWQEISRECQVDPIEIVIQKPSIFIADKGLGMNKAEARKFRYFGHSLKDKKKTVGFRGIGKDSGLAVAEKIIVTTSRYKEPYRHIITIDAQKMLKSSPSRTPLEELLKKYSTIKDEVESRDSHYTFVELNNIRRDSQRLFDIDYLKDYLCHNAPLPFNSEFKYTDEVTKRLKSNISNFSYVDLMLNGEKLFKPFPSDYTRPEYEPIFANDKEDSPLIAYCWYCGHENKGQFTDKENSGLVYRLKNFTVGDRHLPRETLWKATPERAFYFFGEIHVIDEEVIPSSDRTDFEDNEQRTRLYERCRRIAQILNQKAGIESSQRRFGESIVATNDLIKKRINEIKKSQIPIQVKNEVGYEIRKVLDDIQKRLKRTIGKKKKSKEDKELVDSGKKVIKDAKKILKIVESEEAFADISGEVELNTQAKTIYQIVMDCLKEEFPTDTERLRKIINRIDEAITKSFKGHV